MFVLKYLFFAFRGTSNFEFKVIWLRAQSSLCCIIGFLVVLPNLYLMIDSRLNMSWTEARKSVNMAH